MGNAPESVVAGLQVYSIHKSHRNMHSTFLKLQFTKAQKARGEAP